VHLVLERRLPIRHAHADRARRAFGLELRDLVSAQRQTAPVVDPALAARLRRAALLLQPLDGAVAVVRQPPLDELGCPRAMPVEPLRLEVRSVLAADVGPFIPV